jgi:multiple sugar transport system permease protein
MARRRHSLGFKENLAGYIFISPWILGFLFLFGGPIVASFFLSLFEWDIFTPPKWQGIDNYLKLLHDELFWKSLKVTILYATVNVPLSLVIGITVAMLLNQKIPGISLFRTMYYLPSVVSGVAVCLLWAWIYHPDFGYINYFLRLLGIKGPMWLQDPFWALPALIGVGLWPVGGTMIIYLAGLQGIPSQLYEAARIDGANGRQTFFKITLPMLSPVIFYNIIVGLIKALQVFTQPKVMTEGGPNNSTLMYMLYLYRNAFKWFKMGYASALAWILFLVILILTILLIRSASLWVHYEGEVRGR